jgi:hypothetical protein
MRRSSSPTLSGRVNPTEYDSRWEVSQFSTWWVPPAASARTSTRRPGRMPVRWPGSWRSAWRSTAMWSAAVFDPALPARSNTLSGSPVPSGPWSTNAHSG